MDVVPKLTLPPRCGLQDLPSRAVAQQVGTAGACAVR